MSVLVGVQCGGNVRSRFSLSEVPFVSALGFGLAEALSLKLAVVLGNCSLWYYQRTALSLSQPLFTVVSVVSAATGNEVRASCH